MLSLTSTNRVTFAVNVFGTASTPSVRCVVGESPAFSFPASKLSDGQYEVLIDLPKDMNLGTYPFKVEVLLNGRLFTPINHNVAVTGAAEAPAVEIAPLMKSVAADATPLMKSVVAPVAAPLPDVKIEIPAAVESTPEPAQLKGLEILSKTPVFSKLPPAVEIKRVKISMADVAATAEALEQPKRKAAQKAKKPTPVVETRSSIPVSLTKGDVIYR